MSDDLVKRLREAADDEHYWAECQDFWHEEILREAADRIEALTSERDEAIRRRDAWKAKAEGYDEIAAAVRSKIKSEPATLSRVLLRGALVENQARLAKAIKALRNIVEQQRIKDSFGASAVGFDAAHEAEVALAEIEGGKDG